MICVGLWRIAENCNAEWVGENVFTSTKWNGIYKVILYHVIWKSYGFNLDYPCFLPALGYTSVKDDWHGWSGEYTIIIVVVIECHAFYCRSLQLFPVMMIAYFYGNQRTMHWTLPMMLPITFKKLLSITVIPLKLQNDLVMMTSSVLQ